MQNRYVDIYKLSSKIHNFLYHNPDVQKKIKDGKIIVPEAEWTLFLNDMGVMLGFYLQESSSSSS